MSSPPIARFWARSLIASVGLLPGLAAAQNIPLPQSDTANTAGAALSITNTASSTTTRYSAIRGTASGQLASGVLGVGSGTAAIGVFGQGTGANSYGVAGTNNNTGFAGWFDLTGADTVTANAAVKAANAGGSKSAFGEYGQAGNFEITNTLNMDNALYASSTGPGNGGYFVVASADGSDNSTARGNVPISGNPNSSAIRAENHNSGGGNCSITNVPCWGQAGYFAITNTTNQSDAVFAETQTPHATSLHGYIGPKYNPGFFDFVSALAVYGEDLTAAVPAGQTLAGAAVLGASGNGYAAYFVGGASGSGACWFQGGATWSCTAAAGSMQHVSAPDYGRILDRLETLPINYYEIKGAGHPSRNLGPSAEDFRAAFDLGGDDKTVIADGDARGVALAAAKGLYAKLKQDEAEIAQLKQQLAETRTAMASLGTMEAKLARLEAVVDAMPSARPVQEASLTSH